MSNERFVLVTAHGHAVIEFDTPEKARRWAQERKDKAQGYCPELVLIKKTTTVVEEILNYV